LDEYGSEKRRKQAEDTFYGMVKMMQNLHLKVNARFFGAQSIAAALDHAKGEGAQLVVFLAGRGNFSYEDAKHRCFRQPAPGLVHVASQWVNVLREHNDFALRNIAMQACAKLGHTPFVLENSQARGEAILCGVDVCHMRNHRTWKMEHVLAGVRLMSRNGELFDGWLCGNKVEGETIPAAVWKMILPKRLCQGREVIVHRDGRFTEREKGFLAQVASEMGAKDGKLGLVEIVKYADGSPRLYNGSENAPPGSFLRLSDTEGLLVAGTCYVKGTRNPLLVRLVKDHPAAAENLSIETVVRDIFHLGHLSYATLYANTKLPITASTAHKAAYFHASTKSHQTPHGEQPSIISQGRQQYWL